MIVQIFVIAGYVGSMVDGCLKLLRENQRYVWKWIYETPFQSDLGKSGTVVPALRVRQCFSGLGLSLIFVPHFVGCQSEYRANYYQAKRRFKRLSALPFPLAVVYQGR